MRKALHSNSYTTTKTKTEQNTGKESPEAPQSANLHAPQFSPTEPRAQEGQLREKPHSKYTAKGPYRPAIANRAGATSSGKESQGRTAEQNWQLDINSKTSKGFKVTTST